MSGFSFSEESVKLPTGAYAGTRRRMLRLDGQAVLGVTAGQFRPYLYPVYTPAGFAVTSEGPADHPHHHSIWAGADHLHLRMPAMGGREEIYAYNCYVNDIFQGRAPGRINQIALAGQASGAGFLIEQEIEWRQKMEQPPFTHFILITVRSPHQERARFSSETLHRRLKEALPTSVTLGEFAPAPLEKSHGNFRYHIAIRANGIQKVSRLIRDVLDKLTMPEDVFAVVDVDALHLL